MGNFVSGIAALPRIVTLHDIEIVPADQGATGDPGDLTLNVTAKTYRYLDEEEQAARRQGRGRRQGRQARQDRQVRRGRAEARPWRRRDRI